MALARTYAMALVRVEGRVVEVAADIENGLVALLLVGPPVFGLADRFLRPSSSAMASLLRRLA